MSIRMPLIFFTIFFLITTQTLFALTDEEKEKTVMEQLATFSLAGSAIKVVSEESLNALSNGALTNASAMDTLMEFSQYSHTVFSSTSTTGVNFKNIKLLQDKINEVKTSNIANAQKYSKLSTAVEGLDFGLNVLSLGTNTYSFVQNFSKAIDSEGHLSQEASLFAVQNVYETYLASVEIAAKISKFAPKSTVAAFWGNNTFAKGLSKAVKGKWASGLGVVTLGAQIESIIYKHYRDNDIGEINDNIFLINKTNIEKRGRVIAKLIELYLAEETKGEVIELGYISTIMEGYIISPRYNSMYRGKTYQLKQFFSEYVSNTDYLQNTYSVSTFSDLSNEQKILVAIDALIKMAVIEDSESISYLDTVVGNAGGTVADIIFGAFEGSSLYDIYDTESLKKKMFMYYGTTHSKIAYYNTLFKVAFESEVATLMQSKLAEQGREIERMKEAQRVQDEIDTAYSRLLLIDAGTLGDTIAVHFDKGVEYRDEIVAASTLGKRFRIRCQSEEEPLNAVDAYYDMEKAALIYTSPTDTAYSLFQVMIPQAPRWDGDTEERFYTYTLPIGNTGVWAENLSDDGSSGGGETGECPVGATEIACKVGVHIAGKLILGDPQAITINNNLAYVLGYADGSLNIIDIASPSKPELLGRIRPGRTAYDIAIQGNYAYIAYYAEGLKIIDISNPSNPIPVSDLDTDGHAIGITVLDDFLYLADNREGLKIIDVSDPNNPEIISRIDISGFAKNVTVQGDFAYVAGSFGGMTIVNISIKSSPEIVSNYSMSSANKVNIIGTSAYVAAGSDGLIIIDVSDVGNPSLIGSFDTDGNVYSVDIVDNYAYLADYNGGLKIIDITNSSSPKLIGSFPRFGYFTDLFVENNYAYVIDKTIGLKIIDISNPTHAPLVSQTDIQTYDTVVSGSYAYIASGDAGLKIVNILNPESPIIIGSLELAGHAVSIYLTQNIVYVATQSGLEIIDVSDPAMPILLGSIYPGGTTTDVVVVNKYAYISNGIGMCIIDISNSSNPTLINCYDTYGSDAYDIAISGNYAYVADLRVGLRIVDISTPDSLSTVGSYDPDEYTKDVKIVGNYVYLATYQGTKVVDVSNPEAPMLVNQFGESSTNSIFVSNNTAYISAQKEGLKIVDISNPGEPKLLGDTINTGFYPSGSISVSGEYAYISDSSTYLNILNLPRAISDYNAINNYYHPITKISLISENPKDNEYHTEPFTKTWTFSEDVSSFNIEVLSNSYSNMGSFTKDVNTLSVMLTPDTSNPINQLTLKFTNEGNAVKIGNSDTFWSLTRTNNAPRLADGQSKQLAGKIGETLSMAVETYDVDGDSVSLSVKNSDGGSVSFTGTVLNASFPDSETVHTLTLTLNDGKESVDVDITVLRFDSSSIQSFYSDVDPNNHLHYFPDVAAATLAGIVSGQPDTNDSTQRIFRPEDNASMAEVLAMVIGAGKKVALVEMESASYYLDAYPSWSIPYYTFARELGAVKDLGGDLSIIYPTREEIAQIIVKILGLDEKLQTFPHIYATYNDETDFSSDAMIRYAKVARVFGLFMTTDSALPQWQMTRAEMATVVRKIMMIPQADVAVLPEEITFGETVSIDLNNIFAQKISADYSWVDSIGDIGSNFAMNLHLIDTPQAYDSSLMFAEVPNQLVSMVNNNGIYNIIVQDINVSFDDSDGDGVPDSDDVWVNNPFYHSDKNGNGIPDSLDVIYELTSYTADGTVIIDGEEVSIAYLIESSGTDDDGDGISNYNDEDLNDGPLGDCDGDGIKNEDDPGSCDKQSNPVNLVPIYNLLLG